MDVRIGIIQTPKEIEVEMTDEVDREELLARGLVDEGVDGALELDPGMEAESLFGRAIGIQERAVGPDHVYVAEMLVGLAKLLEEQARTVESLALYERALAIKEREFSPDHPELADLRTSIAALRAGA